jgi:hypothetical protein
MAQRCSHCGRTQKNHNGPDGKYRACLVLSSRLVERLKAEAKKAALEPIAIGELEKSRQQQSQTASVQGGDDFGQHEPK